MARDPKTRSAFMTASTDLHHQPQATNSPHTIASPWGTWEELLLASAVKKYGHDNWALISAELRSRIWTGSFTFTPEACQVKYEAIKLRFGFAGASEKSDGTCWFEELRRLRVAQLKRELKQYDSSIGSLEEKIRKLQSERVKDNSQKSLCVEEGVVEPEGERYDRCKPGSLPGQAESDVSTCCNDAASVEVKENDEGQTPLQIMMTPWKADDDDGDEGAVTKEANEHPPASKDKMATKNVSHELSYSKVKAEMPTEEDAMSEPWVHKMTGGIQTLASKELAIKNPQPGKPDAKDHRANLPSEVWGCSLEVVCTHKESATKKAKFSAEGRIQNLHFSRLNHSELKRVVMVPLTPAELSAKAESISTNNEGSDSVQASGSPGENVDSMEAWHHLERLSGDSRVEKSESSSPIDLSEDISPMSKTNKREPKVCGKLIPLLISLRNISAHRCAPLFRHQRESQSNRRYHLMIRAPLDLGMIRAKLEEGQYGGSLDFFRDLLLMVTNALVYYSKDSSESAAASGLQECIMREMESIFKTEFLVKQEGPTVRKRESEKARQLSPIKRVKVVGAPMSLPSGVDNGLKEVAFLQGCSPISSMDDRDDQSNAKAPGGKGATTIDEREKNRTESVKSKSLASKTSTVDTKESVVTDDRRTAPVTTGASSNTKGPLKRGVGRPPKNFHDQDPRKAKEASMSPRKRPKR